MSCWRDLDGQEHRCYRGGKAADPWHRAHVRDSAEETRDFLYTSRNKNTFRTKRDARGYRRMRGLPVTVASALSLAHALRRFPSVAFVSSLLGNIASQQMRLFDGGRPPLRTGDPSLLITRTHTLAMREEMRRCRSSANGVFLRGRFIGKFAGKFSPSVKIKMPELVIQRRKKKTLQLGYFFIYFILFYFFTSPDC